jgi:hypothetical protein
VQATLFNEAIVDEQHDFLYLLHTEDQSQPPLTTQKVNPDLVVRLEVSERLNVGRGQICVSKLRPGRYKLIYLK